MQATFSDPTFTRTYRLSDTSEKIDHLDCGLMLNPLIREEQPQHARTLRS
jgi:hypothetical protein